MEKKMVYTRLKIRFPYHEQASLSRNIFKKLMVSTNRKKVLKLVSISRNKTTF